MLLISKDNSFQYKKQFLLSCNAFIRKGDRTPTMKHTVRMMLT